MAVWFLTEVQTRVPMIVVACQAQPLITTSALNKKTKINTIKTKLISLSACGEDHREVIKGLIMFVCFFSPMLLLLLLFFCFPRVTV